MGLYMCICVCLRVCMWAYVCMYVYACVRVCIYVYVCICVYMCVCVCMCISVCMEVYVCVYVYVSVRQLICVSVRGFQFVKASVYVSGCVSLVQFVSDCVPNTEIYASTARTLTTHIDKLTQVH